jgi:hypothetical protein
MTFYLRTNGDNANDGLTAATAMLTFNALMARIYNEWDFCGYNVTVDIGEGTWTGETWVIERRLISGNSTISIVGAGMGKTIMTGASGISQENITGASGLVISSGGYDPFWLRLQSMTFVNNTIHINVMGSTLLFRGIEFGYTFSQNNALLRAVRSQIQSEDGYETDPTKFSKITATQTYLGVQAVNYSKVEMPTNFSISNPLTVLNSLINLDNSSLYFSDATYMTGVVTGIKYSLNRGSVLVNSNRVPGTVAGKADASSFAL